jgi:outer membrane protein assembly factor BamB
LIAFGLLDRRRKGVMMISRFSGFIAAGAIAGAAVAADDWTQFRGPNADNIAKGPPVPTEWSADKNIKWKTAIPGTGWAAPVVVGNYIYVTSAYSEKQGKLKPMTFGGGGGGGGGGRGGFERAGGDRGGPPGAGKGDPKDAPKGEAMKRPGGGRGGFEGGSGGFGRTKKAPEDVYQWHVFCLDRKTGEIVWKKEAVSKKPSVPTHSTNTYASETPLTDGERLYVYFGMTGLYCYSLDGKQLWSVDLGSYPMFDGWGTGSSPVLHGDKLFVQCDNEEKSFLVALDKKTGKELWRKPREEKSNWSTPYIWKNKSRTELVTLGQNRARSYNPENGDVLWEMSGLKSGTISSPASDADAIYFGIAGPRSDAPMFAVKAGASGDISLTDGETSNEFVMWKKLQTGTRAPSPLLIDGRLYLVGGMGGTLLTCLDAKTGEQIYKERLQGARGVTTSPWFNDGKVFILDEDGNAFVVKAGPKFEVVGKGKLGEMFWSSPAISDGAIFLRGSEHLYCIK